MTLWYRIAFCEGIVFRSLAAMVAHSFGAPGDILYKSTEMGQW